MRDKIEEVLYVLPQSPRTIICLALGPIAFLVFSLVPEMVVWASGTDGRLGSIFEAAIGALQGRATAMGGVAWLIFWVGAVSVYVTDRRRLLFR